MKKKSIRLNKFQKEVVESLSKIPITNGEQRAIYVCRTCGRVQAQDYIPFSIGRGRTFNMCLCNAVSSNWTSYEAQLVKTIMSPRVAANEAAKKLAAKPVPKAKPALGPSDTERLDKFENKCIRHISEPPLRMVTEIEWRIRVPVGLTLRQAIDRL